MAENKNFTKKICVSTFFKLRGKWVDANGRPKKVRRTDARLACPSVRIFVLYSDNNTSMQRLTILFFFMMIVPVTVNCKANKGGDEKRTTENAKNNVDICGSDFH